MKVRILDESIDFSVDAKILNSLFCPIEAILSRLRGIILGRRVKILWNDRFLGIRRMDSIFFWFERFDPFSAGMPSPRESQQRQFPPGSGKKSF